MLATLKSCAFLLAAAMSAYSQAAEVVLPLTRTAYYSREPIEIAVCGLANGARATVELVPAAQGLQPVRFDVAGVFAAGGGAVNTILPPYALAPGQYTIRLDGKDTPLKLAIAAGVRDSTMLVSQMTKADELRSGGANFAVGQMINGRGLLDKDGLPDTNVRRLGPDLKTLNDQIAADMPTMVYMWWSGYVTHKPYGGQKTWETDAMTEILTLRDYSAAQMMRRAGENITTAGTLDEPGLNIGKNRKGVLPGGPFSPWDAAPWYQRRNAPFNAEDPGSMPDDQWMAYMRARDAVIGDQNQRAHDIMHTVWPEGVFATDIYACMIAGDGCDVLNQRCNDVPRTHVFGDFGGVPRLHVGTFMACEVAASPGSHVAHCMNGQLTGRGGVEPQPQHRFTYHAAMNSMLQNGLHSNWWLQLGAMKPEDLRAVNTPAKMYGPVTLEMKPAADVAILWSHTELCMRLKPITAKAAQAGPDDKWTDRINDLPENPLGLKELDWTHDGWGIYSLQYNYRWEVCAVHMALARAGYAAHIVDERVLPERLKDYKVLVICCQSQPLPSGVRKAIDKWQARGGKVVVDTASSVPFKDAIRHDGKLKDAELKLELLLKELDRAQKTTEASLWESNWFVDGMVKALVPPLKAAMEKTKAEPVIRTDGADLIASRHTAGKGQLIMVLNGNEDKPPVTTAKDGKSVHRMWSLAPHKATFTLASVPKGSTVYRIEGLDWKKVTKVADWKSPQTAEFEPGEMKLYLVARREPKEISLKAKLDNGALNVSAKVRRLKMPWPITVTVTDQTGKVLYEVWRATNADGEYSETFPLGTNAAVGARTVSITSPAGRLAAQARVEQKPVQPALPPVAGAVRVFDAPAIRRHLAARPEIAIAIDGDTWKAAAQKLADALRAKGIRASVADEKAVFHRVRYPRIWDPYVRVWKKADGEEKKPSGEVQQTLKLSLADDGRVVAMTADGKDMGAAWRKPSTLVEVAEPGFLAWAFQNQEEIYEPGVKFYISEKNAIEPLNAGSTEVNSTDDLRAKWSRPWTRLVETGEFLQIPPFLPEAYGCDKHLVLLGGVPQRHEGSELVRALQASEILPQVVDEKYPGPGKALVEFAWSPFGVEKNVIFIGATDAAGIDAGIAKVIELVAR